MMKTDTLLRLALSSHQLLAASLVELICLQFPFSVFPQKSRVFFRFGLNSELQKNNCHSPPKLSCSVSIL